MRAGAVGLRGRTLFSTFVTLSYGLIFLKFQILSSLLLLNLWLNFEKLTHSPFKQSKKSLQGTLNLPFSLIIAISINYSPKRANCASRWLRAPLQIHFFKYLKVHINLLSSSKKCILNNQLRRAKFAHAHRFIIPWLCQVFQKIFLKK